MLRALGADGAAGEEDSSQNAHSKETTIASGSNTHGQINQHPASTADGLEPHVGGLPDGKGSNAAGQASASSGSAAPAGSTGAARASEATGGGHVPFRVGVAEDRNKRWRRTMEDSHAFVYDFGGVQGQGFFSVFDGHAGKHSAEWCGMHFHEYLTNALKSSGKKSVPDVLNETFHAVDAELSKLAQEQGTSSGCTAVTAFLRLEDADGVPVAGPDTGGIASDAGGQSAVVGGAAAGQQDGKASGSGSGGKDEEKKSGGSGIFSAFSRRNKSASVSEKDGAASAAAKPQKPALASNPSGLITVTGKEVRRVLYTANVGDARAVLCRGGKAIRLTYDHKGSDAQEAKRITDAGGFVMNNRVNGVLAVTRSLGDSSMKEFVVGAPYTTETTLTEEDSLLIVACDGLWDVVDDQDAVELIKDVQDAQEAAAKLLKHALENFSTDNTSVMVIRFAVPASAVTDPKTG